MKLNRTMKQLLSVVLSLALIVTSLVIGPTTANAAEEFGNIAKKINSDGTFDVTWDKPAGTEFTKVYLLEGTQTEDAELTDGDAAKNKSANWIWNDNPQYGGAGEGKADGVVSNKSGTVKVTRGNTYTLILIAYSSKTVADETTEIARTAVVVDVPAMTPEEESESIAKAEEESRQQAEIEKLNTKMQSSLALNKPMKAGSQRTSGDVLSNINDGNINTGYQAAEGSKLEDNWFYVDLGAEKDVNTVIIKWQAAHAAEYDIYVATTEDADGNPEFGEPVASEKNGKEGYVTTVFETTKARYVKVATTKFDADWAGTYGIKAFEFGVYAEGIESPEPIAPSFGLELGTPEDGVFTVVWGQDDAMIATGQLYNIYVDDVKVKEGVGCQSYTIEAEPGTHTVKITAVLDDKESEPYIGEVTVTGEQQSETDPSNDEGWIDGIVSEDNETWNDLGAWQYILMAMNKSEAKIKGGDLVDNFSFRPSKTQYNVQGSAIKRVIDTVPGTEYEYSALVNTINPNEKNAGRLSLKIYRADGQVDNNYVFSMINLSDGENDPITGKYTASVEKTVVEIQLGWIEPGVQFDLKGFTFKEAEPEIPIPDPPTAEEIPEGYTLVPPNTDPWVSVGSTEAWLIYAGTWSGTQYAYAATKNGENPNELSVAFPKTTGNDGWLVQVQYTFDDINIGEMYKYQIKDGDKVLKTKIFTGTEPTYTTEKIGLGETPEGSTLNLVATVEPYDPDAIPSPFPEGKKFDDIIDSKYNALLNAEYTQTSRYGEDTPGALTNGTALEGSGYLCTGKGERNEDVIVTLKNEQDVANIAMAAIDFNNNLSTAAEYTISISQDGENFEEIGSYTTDNSNEETFKKVALEVDTSNVTFEKYKYVKLNLNGVNQWGYQVMEFALISKIKIEKPTEPPTPKPDNPTKPNDPTKPSDPQPTTKAPETTPVAPQPTTKANETTTVVPQQTTKADAGVKVGKTKVKSASKKKASKKLKVSIKKISGATKYQVQISKTKKFKKVLVKKNVKKVKFTISSKKIKNLKKIYVRVRAYKVVGGKRYNGDWSKTKKITVKK